MKYQRSELDNGIRVVSCEMRDRQSTSLGFWVGVGGRHEEKDIKGAAHFLEHTVFKGSRKYTCNQIKHKVEGIGGTLNAFTSEEQTCYFAKIPSRYFRQGFDVLSDIVFYPKLSKREILKEAGVIVEEIKMYRDLPQYYVIELLDGLMWPGHPLGDNLAGSPEIISKMAPQRLRGFFKSFYTPRNVVIASCGNMKHDALLRLVKRKLKGIPQKGSQELLPAPSALSKKHCHFAKRNIEQMHVAIGALGFDRWHKERYTASLLSIILGGNMSSRLFNEIREKRGLAYSISSHHKTFHDTGMFLIRAGVDNSKIVDAIELILRELRKISRRGVSKEEFKQGKDYLVGQMLLGLEDTMEHMLWLGEGMITKNQMKSMDEIVKEFRKIKVEDIRRVAGELFRAENMRCAVVGPVSPKQEKDIRKLFTPR